MVRKQGGLVPIGDALSGMGGPVKALREATPQAVHHFTRFDQVNQLVSASEADPDLGFMGAAAGALLLAAKQPRQPEQVCARQRSLHPRNDCRDQHQAPLRQPAAPDPGLGLH